MRRLIVSLLTAIVATPPVATAEPLPLCGVSLAGAEFGDRELPGQFNRDYFYPASAELDYFRERGMTVFRLPFRWERLQRAARGPLDDAELTRIRAVVDHAAAIGASVILDPHNYARYRPGPQPADGLVGSTVPIEAFADFWSKLTREFDRNPRVIFGLMNEPHDIDTDQWVAAANAAIAAIRQTGSTHLILVPGNRWTGGWTWQNADAFGRANAAAMLDIVDPGNNFAFEIHQYFDADGSGSSANIGASQQPNDPAIGVQRLSGLTRWLEANHRRAFLGEFAVANSTIGDAPDQCGDELTTQLLDFLDAHREVWLGWTWWAAGPNWGDYLFTLEPAAGRAERPAMQLLARRLQKN